MESTIRVNPDLSIVAEVENETNTSRPPLGLIACDTEETSNERTLMHAPLANRARIFRDQFVRIVDPLGQRSGFLGRIVAGPFFPQTPAGTEPILAAYVEIQGELVDGMPVDAKSRPASGSIVEELSTEEICRLLGFAGDMLLGTVTNQDKLRVRLQSKNKGVLPRNVGIFGTVGSGKSNTAQVLIEEAAAAGWSVIVIDVEGEYIDMSEPSIEESHIKKMEPLGRTPCGLTDFQVYHAASCASDKSNSEPFTLRLADFDTSVICEILQTTVGERNALLDCVEYFEQKNRNKVATSEAESLSPLLNASPQAKLSFTLRSLKERSGERSARSNEFFDYTGLSTKLTWLLLSGAFDQPNMRSFDPERLIRPGHVSIIDVSVSNDIVKNLVTADLLRKTFAYKLARTNSPPILLVIEEAHSFISKENVKTMQATLQMLRNVVRRGRKRWLSLAFISQQPGHLPPEIFELCNTRIVHTLRSMHNLEAMMSTAGDVSQEIWTRCPLLGPGQAVITSPQLNRPVIVNIRPAKSMRRFLR